MVLDNVRASLRKKKKILRGLAILILRLAEEREFRRGQRKTKSGQLDGDQGQREGGGPLIVDFDQNRPNQDRQLKKEDSLLLLGREEEGTTKKDDHNVRKGKGKKRASNLAPNVTNGGVGRSFRPTMRKERGGAGGEGGRKGMEVGGLGRDGKDCSYGLSI